MESLIAAVVTGIIAAGASIYASKTANDKTLTRLECRMDAQETQIGRLEEKQDKANQVKERVALLERDMGSVRRELSELKKGA